MGNQAKSLTKKLSQDYELIFAAYHEAAHTICGLLFNMKIPDVFVIPSPKRGDDLGCTHYEIIPDTFEDNELTKALQLSEINMFYAGLVAEKIHYKDVCGSDKYPMMLRIGCSQDILKAADLIKKLDLAPPGEQRYAYKQKLLRQLRKLLVEHWGAIKIIAHQLYQKKKLYYSDLKEILTKR